MVGVITQKSRLNEFFKNTSAPPLEQSSLCSLWNFHPSHKLLTSRKISKHSSYFVNNDIDYWAQALLDETPPETFKRLDSGILPFDISFYIHSQIGWFLGDAKAFREEKGREPTNDEELIEYSISNGDSLRYRVMFGLMRPDMIYLNTGRIRNTEQVPKNKDTIVGCINFFDFASSESYRFSETSEGVDYIPIICKNTLRKLEEEGNPEKGRTGLLSCLRDSTSIYTPI